MSYASVIKRAKKAINDAMNRDQAATVHKVDIDTDISRMNGLIVVMHPDYGNKGIVGKLKSILNHF